MTAKVETKDHWGIPEAVFIEDADQYIKTGGFPSYAEAWRDMEEKYQKYKYMEQNLLTRRQRLMQQIPDITKTLAVVQHLQKSGKPFETTFELADQLYARAKVEDVGKVGLWLGANVMLEYDLADAESVLQTNETTAEKNLSTLDENLDFLKDQITTSEVNLARLYNLNMKAGKSQQVGQSGESK